MEKVDRLVVDACVLRESMSFHFTCRETRLPGPIFPFFSPQNISHFDLTRGRKKKFSYFSNRKRDFESYIVYYISRNDKLASFARCFTERKKNFERSVLITTRYTYTHIREVISSLNTIFQLEEEGEGGRRERRRRNFSSLLEIKITPSNEDWTMALLPVNMNNHWINNRKQSAGLLHRYFLISGQEYRRFLRAIKFLSPPITSASTGGFDLERNAYASCGNNQSQGRTNIRPSVKLDRSSSPSFRSL